MESIPWRLGESEEISLWIWETEHFNAKIQTDRDRVRFIWRVEDHSQGVPSPLSDGFTGSLRESEAEVRELIGKSYPPSLGYHKYAGHYATTFTIFNGDKIDFGSMVAKKVILTVRIVDDSGKVKEKRLVGRLNVDHYKIRLTPEHGNPVKVPPSRIVSVKQEFGGDAKPVSEENTAGKNLRIFAGNMATGCTGKPGFMPNTVEHSKRAARCPIHEQ